MKVVIVTGTRAEYGIWTPVLRAITRSKKLHLQLVVTGTHLLPAFGSTLKQIVNDGFTPAAIVPMYCRGDAPADSLARGTSGLARAFSNLAPDIILVLGDRLEILAAAQAALCLQIPIGHVHGGETAPGQFDEQIRHAVTKMAHVHFAATPCAAARIRQMGENPKHVHVVGAPALDIASVLAREFQVDQHRISGRPLLLFHPMSPDEQLEFQRTKLLIDTIQKAYRPECIDALGPNNDPGHTGILDCYAEQNSENFELSPSVSAKNYWDMLWTCPFLIGNSSSGIIEAATFHIPVINIGERQAGRKRSGNVIDVPYNAAAITSAIKKATSTAFLRTVDRTKNIYGDGNASARIVRILEHLNPARLVPKKFVDI